MENKSDPIKRGKNIKLEKNMTQQKGVKIEKESDPINRGENNFTTKNTEFWFI